ncbi:MAG: ribonuclease HI [Bacteroidia bacterium]|nr:ribonuclease HI [Bacteroidia bacterium]
MPDVTIYTDGSALGNPGPGGYGVVLISGKYRKELSAGYRLTTNNRMELLAVIKGLEALTKNNCNVTVYSDSQYVVNALEKGWLAGWEKKNFKKRLNTDLWKRFLIVYRKHKVKFVWLRGHSGYTENERCDELATSVAASSKLLEDAGYRAGTDGSPSFNE